MKKKILLIISLTMLVTSCSFLENVAGSLENSLKKSDPYAENSTYKVGTNKNKEINEKKAKEFSELEEVKKLEAQLKENLEKIEKDELKKEDLSNIDSKKEDLKNKINNKIIEKFEETDEKIVNFIDEKVHEDADKIKEITIEGINKLMLEKKIKMSRREFLARTYEIIKENNMTSYYLAAGRLLNQLMK